MSLICAFQDGATPLHETATDDSPNHAGLLIRSGADLNAKDKVSSAIISMNDTSASA